jgi:Flp pilus assembly protein TadB
MSQGPNTREGVHPTPDDRAPRREPVPDPLGDVLERTSPEGRPPRPALKSWQIRHLVLAFAGVLLIVGVLVAIFVHPVVGFVGMVGSLVMFAVNPALWATFSRYGERRRAEDQLKNR